jgi:hypothetical protein
MADVEMKPAEEKPKNEKKDDEKMDEKKEGEKKDSVKPPPTPVAEIKSNVVLIERAVSTLEPRFTHRVLRTLTALRKRIDDKVLRDAVEELYPKGRWFISDIWDSVVIYCYRRAYKDFIALLATSRTCRGSIHGHRPRSDTFKDSS